jgi:regulatory factor X, other
MIKECDWMMYQKMIGNVSQLTLQVAPPQVLRFLDNVSKTLHNHISKVFQTLPLHTREAKLEPATLFAHLIRQMLRVNSTAHAAAVFLARDEVRDQMWADWKAYVNVKRIMENELPGCGHEEVFKILNQDVRSMLLPLNTQVWLPDGTYYQETTAETEREASNDTVIDRIAALLGNLPSRFPQASTRTLLQCVNGLGSAAIREITVEGGPSFQAWWLTKTFVDEMGHWLASLGGFLDHKPPTYGALTFSPGIMDGPLDSGMTNGGSNNDSRYSSMDADFGANQSFMTTGDISMQDTGASNTNDSKSYHVPFKSRFEG